MRSCSENNERQKKLRLRGCIPTRREALFVSAASSRKWGPEEILNSKNYEAEEKEIEKAKVRGVIFLRSLTGERSPHNDVNAKGAFIGLSARRAAKGAKR